MSEFITEIYSVAMFIVCLFVLFCFFFLGGGFIVVNFVCESVTATLFFSLFSLFMFSFKIMSRIG